MWDSFDPRERTICGIATVVGGRGAVVGGAWPVRCDATRRAV